MKPSLLLSLHSTEWKDCCGGQSQKCEAIEYNRDFSGAILHLSEIWKHMPGGIEVLFWNAKILINSEPFIALQMLANNFTEVQMSPESLRLSEWSWWGHWQVTADTDSAFKSGVDRFEVLPAMGTRHWISCYLFILPKSTAICVLIFIKLWQIKAREIRQSSESSAVAHLLLFLRCSA